MILWTQISSEEATRGVTNKAWEAQRVVIDSRNIQTGDLFVAIKGEHFDGHEFVEDALSRGAVAAVISQKSGLPDDASLLVVEDTQKALEDLARYARKRSSAKVIGVTGSVGKTSTKEMLKLAFSAHGKTYATKGNYNNHIGTPLSLANLPEGAEFAIFEMGMNHAGEIATLTRMVQPHIAIITNIDAVHLEFFDSVDGIVDAKAEIFEGMVDDGVAILNADSGYLNYLKMSAARNEIGRIITFGESLEADVRLIAYQPTQQGAEIDASIGDDLLTYSIQACGRHWAKTTLITLATLNACELDSAKTLAALAEFKEPDGRGKRVSLSMPQGGVTLIDDSYNASPISMRSAFLKIEEMHKSTQSKGRKIAVLGDMFELGEQAADFHVALAVDLQQAGFDCVYSAGKMMRSLHDALPSSVHGVHVDDPSVLPQILGKDLQAEDLLLIKGSHASNMYKVAQELICRYQKKETKHAV